MKILLDTNVLLRLDDESHVQHAEALNAVERLNDASHECVLVPQVIYEYWVVATRPLEVNGLGLDVVRVDQLISDWTALFPILKDERGIFTAWRTLVTTHDVKGKIAHDARLVAAMKRHGVDHLLTFNKPDFSRFARIEVLAPKEILSGYLPS